MMDKSKRILVTGGAGYIGSHFLKELKKLDVKNVLTIDNLSNGSKDNIIIGELNDANILKETEVSEIIKNFKPDIIVHFAGKKSISESVKKPFKYYIDNFVGSLTVLHAAIENNVNKFIFSSTAAVYSSEAKVPFNEESAIAPCNPYGNTKIMFEKLLEDVKKANPEFNYIILRYFNVAGNDPELEVGNMDENPINLIQILVNNIIKEKNEINIFGNDYATKDGTGIRDYIHVSDLARAHIDVIPLLDKGSFIFNVGYGTGYSVLDVINSVEKVCNVEIQKNFTNRREGDVAESIADNKKILEMTEWKPKDNDLNYMIKTSWEWAKHIHAKSKEGKKEDIKLQ